MSLRWRLAASLPLLPHRTGEEPTIQLRIEPQARSEQALEARSYASDASPPEYSNQPQVPPIHCRFIHTNHPNKPASLHIAPELRVDDRLELAGARDLATISDGRAAGPRSRLLATRLASYHGRSGKTVYRSSVAVPERQ